MNRSSPGGILRSLRAPGRARFPRQWRGPSARLRGAPTASRGRVRGSLLDSRAPRARSAFANVRGNCAPLAPPAPGPRPAPRTHRRPRARIGGARPRLAPSRTAGLEVFSAPTDRKTPRSRASQPCHCRRRDRTRRSGAAGRRAGGRGLEGAGRGPSQADRAGRGGRSGSSGRGGTGLDRGAGSGRQGAESGEGVGDQPRGGTGCCRGETSRVGGREKRGRWARSAGRPRRSPKGRAQLPGGAATSQSGRSTRNPTAAALSAARDRCGEKNPAAPPRGSPGKAAASTGRRRRRRAVESAAPQRECGGRGSSGRESFRTNLSLFYY